VSAVYCRFDLFLSIFIYTVKSLFVGEEPVVFTLNGEDESVWMIETESDRILFLSFSSDSGIGDNNVANHLKNYLTV